MLIFCNLLYLGRLDYIETRPMASVTHLNCVLLRGLFLLGYPGLGPCAHVEGLPGQNHTAKTHFQTEF